MNREDILKQHNGLIWSVVHKYKASIHDHDEEDIHQELLMHVYSKLPNYNPDKSSITTFINMVCENKCLNMIKYKNNKYTELVEELPEEELEELAPIESIALEVAFEVLREHPNKDILMSRLMGERSTDIAKRVNMSKQNISRIWGEFINEVREKL